MNQRIVLREGLPEGNQDRSLRFPSLRAQNQLTDHYLAGLGSARKICSHYHNIPVKLIWLLNILFNVAVYLLHSVSGKAIQITGIQLRHSLGNYFYTEVLEYSIKYAQRSTMKRNFHQITLHQNHLEGKITDPNLHLFGYNQWVDAIGAGFTINYSL